MSDYNTLTTALSVDDPELVPCEHCGQLVPRSELCDVYTGDAVRNWCEECAETDATECDRCGTLTATDDLSKVDGDNWCSECVDYHACWCDHCNDYHDYSGFAAVVVDWRGCTEDWCEGCVDEYATRCEDCDTLFDPDSCGASLDMYDGETRDVCPSCEDNYYRCDDCGDYVSGDRVISDDYGDTYCPNCARDNSPDLQGYGHTYADDFFSVHMDPTPALYMGIELETEPTDGRPGALATEVCDAGGRERLCCKYDGSLENGCEIVTQPMTPAYHLTSDMWPAVLEACREHGTTSHDNRRCGLHVHVSRSYFGHGYEADTRICTLDRLIQTHSEEWRRFARRTVGQLDQWAAIETPEALGIEPTDAPAIKREKWGKQKSRCSRYRALNLTNFATVEFRLWRGSLNPETLRATIEATAALAIVAHDVHDAEAVEGWSWGVLKRELVNALGRYGLPSDDLTAYLTRRGL